MTTRLNVEAPDVLVGRTIKSVKNGHPCKQERTYDDKRKARNDYGVLTIETDKGTYVLSCSMLASEITVSSEVDE